MLSTGFANAPVSRSLVYALVGTSILASITDTKHYFYIQVDPHLWRYHQLWRIFAYQLCYTNSTEVLFAAMTVYNMRVIERLWGSSTPLIFSLLAQYHAVIPHVYKYRIAASPYLAPSSVPNTFTGLTFSDKSYVYLPAIQLALSQLPGSLLSAVVGWVVGYFWRNEVLPGRVTRWRVPGWVVGEKKRRRRSDFEGLRRRLESEGGVAGEGQVATGSDGRLGVESPGRRRTMGRQFMDQFRGA
ncbi:hypothetical protein PZA11_001064 [Diplocarpon coronariae]